MFRIISKIVVVTILLVLLFSGVCADNNPTGNETINDVYVPGENSGYFDSDNKLKDSFNGSIGEDPVINGNSSLIQGSNETFVDNAPLGSSNELLFADPFDLCGITEKNKLSDSQKKLSTSLIHLVDSSYLPPSVSEIDFIGGMVDLDQLILSNGVDHSEDLVYVYVYLHPEFSTSVIDPYVHEIKGRDEKFHYAAAYVKVTDLDSLASLDAVRFIMEVIPPVTNSGSADSEGDTILKTKKLRQLTGFTGQGIKVGIISDGVDHVSDSQATGDLPANVNVLSNTQGGDEGTAMLEIVHDMAPGAELYFHDAGSNTIEFNKAIDALVDAGCDVICDDIGWPHEPYFEDGSIASHVDEVLKNNAILYVSSAGNHADKHYQGDFYNQGDGFHDFSGGNSDLKYIYFNLFKNSIVQIYLQWNDPFGASYNDYDLYLFNNNDRKLLTKSIITQNGALPPLEAIIARYTGENTIGVIAVKKYSGSCKNLELFVFSGSTFSNNIVKSDSIFGHPAVNDVISVGAIAASDPNNDDIEPFSSQGAVTICYPSYEKRNKPDIAGIDGVSVTGAGGFGNPFYGTSASAPGIAGLLVLIMDACPDKSPDEIKQALYSSADDLGNSGFDYKFGYGRANAIRLFDSFSLTNGSISVSSNPVSAGVYLDSVYKGITPLTITDVSAGNHMVTLTKTGYVNYTTPISVNAGAVSYVNATLKGNDASELPENSLFIGDNAVSIYYLIDHPGDAQTRVNQLIGRQSLTLVDLWYRINDGSVWNIMTGQSAGEEEKQAIQAALETYIDKDGEAHELKGTQ